MEEPIHAPAQAELPTRQQLNRATLISVGVAAVLLVTTVLPAEYGYDPTGIGSVVGLTPMGKMKMEAAAEADVDPQTSADSGDITMDEPASVPAAATGEQSGEVTLTLAVDEGTEVKATMRAGDELRYEWTSGDAKVNFELHGEEIGASGSDYTSYEKGTSSGQSGTFRAPFDGTHGWYWRNRTAAPLTITVKARGAFSKFARVP